MFRYLVISIIAIAILGLLPGLSAVSTLIEISLLATAYAMLLLFPNKRQGMAVLPVFNKYTDGFLLLFLLSWLLTSLMNRSFGFENVFVLIRYIGLAYLVAKFLTSSDIEKISSLIVLFGISQVLIGALQLAGALPQVMVAVLDEKEGLYGIFKDNISYASLMLVSLIVSNEMLRLRYRYNMMLAFLFLIFLLLSGSRAYFLVGLLYFALRVLNISVMRLSILGLISLGAIFSIGINMGASNKDFLFFLSSAYLVMAMHQRLGIIVELLPQFLMSPNALLGLGADRDFVVAHAVQNYTFKYISPDHLPMIIEDVYWSSMLMYYGILGAMFFVIYLLGAYVSSIKLLKKDLIDRRPIWVFTWLISGMFFLGMTGQVLEVKAYSLFLWIFAGASLVMRKELNERAANK